MEAAKFSETVILPQHYVVSQPNLNSPLLVSLHSVKVHQTYGHSTARFA